MSTTTIIPDDLVLVGSAPDGAPLYAYRPRPAGESRPKMNPRLPDPAWDSLPAICRRLRDQPRRETVHYLNFTEQGAEFLAGLRDRRLLAGAMRDNTNYEQLTSFLAETILDEFIIPFEVDAGKVYNVETFVAYTRWKIRNSRFTIISQREQDRVIRGGDGSF